MLNNTHIVLRIPGFYALLERRHQNIPESTALLVCAGEGSRALILSACELAVHQGARPGMRIGMLSSFKGEIVHASPVRYASEEMALCEHLGLELPNPHIIRPGVIRSLWSRGQRFLSRALDNASVRLNDLGYRGAWGIGPGDAVSEIAAAIAPIGERLAVPTGSVRSFLTPYSLRLLPDLGAAQLAALAEIGVTTFGHLLSLPPEVLRSLFGPDGIALRRIATQGTRGPMPAQWRGRKRLGEDTADLKKVQMAVSTLVADGLAHVLVNQGRVPRAMWLTLVYTDQRRAGSRLVASHLEHEGNWQRLAHELIDKLWTRRVRIAEVRLSVSWGAAPSEQLCMFVSSQRQFRDRELTHAVTRVRDRWGSDLVQYAVADGRHAFTTDLSPWQGR
jgi:hypothetical protein